MRQSMILMLVAFVAGAVAGFGLGGRDYIGIVGSAPDSAGVDGDVTLDDRADWSSVPQHEVSPSPKTADPPTSVDRSDDDGQATADIAQAGQETAQQSASEESTASDKPVVDETALRFFAQQGDTRRLNAEISRLKALYPGWTPPADPAAIVPQGDPQLDAMWKLYSEQKYAELRKAVSVRKSADPKWTPPQDLMERLAVAEARERLINASELKQYETVVRVAAETSSLLTCADVDVLWRLAEAFANTKRTDRAKDVYLYVLRNCDDPNERLATAQKALALLPAESMGELLATERKGADGVGEFAPIRAEQARRSVAAGGKNPPADAPAADLAAVETLAEKDGLASDALLLGWYFLQHQQTAKAAEWFTRARGREDTAEASQGLALALIEEKRLGEAEAVAYPWRDASAEMGKVYLAAAAGLLGIEPPTRIEPEVLERIVTAVAAAKDPATAQQLGWYAYALGQERTAGQWFATALQWKPNDEPSAYGLALTRNALGDKAGLGELKRQWRGRSDRIDAIGRPASRRTKAMRRTGQIDPQTTGAVRQAETKVTSEASAASRSQVVVADAAPVPTGCARTDLHSTATGSAALRRGWCLMELDRPAEAVLAFEAAMTGGSNAVRRDAAYGQSLAYLRSRLTNEAAVAAAKMPQPRDRALQLEEAILSMRAGDLFGKKRYAETLLTLDQRARIAPERRDLMALRGYAYLALGRRDEARQIFEALRAAGDKEGQRGLAAIQAATRKQD